MTAVTSGALFAAERHDVCVTQRHECGQAAAAMKCDCCGQARPDSENGTPAEVRVEILRSAAIAPVAVSGSAFIAMALPAFFDCASPPCPHLLDRSIRFGVLLI